MKTYIAESERGTVTHFRVTAREMLFDQPECCPIYGGLSFDGLAIDDDGVHLIVRTTSARAYLGHELPVVAKRAYILAVALVDAGVIDTDQAGGVIRWLGECWTAVTSEIAQAAGLTTGHLATRPGLPTTEGAAS
jgi:hypothetical protein